VYGNSKLNMASRRYQPWEFLRYRPLVSLYQHQVCVVWCISWFVNVSMMQVLSRLLRSKNAEDLQAANRLIKNLVKQVLLLSDLL